VNIKKAYAIYFSPTGTTEKAVIAAVGGMGLPIEKIDLTLLNTREKYSRSFQDDELAVVGLPVYGGRLPRNLNTFFSGLKGNGTPAVALVMYGNREYDDALIELKIRLEERGFGVKAGAAFIGEHTFSKNIATGRPDGNDLNTAAGFGKRIIESIYGGAANTLIVKGHYPSPLKGYDPATPGTNPIYPQIMTTDSCIKCGLCAENCPWGAINPQDVTRVDSALCLRCFRCLKVCPVQAKQVTDEKFMAFIPLFEKRLNTNCREPELFLPK